jgi:hypothetical protein
MLGTALLTLKVVEKNKPHQQQTLNVEDTPVIPSSLQRTKSIELGQLILILMPGKDEHEGAVDWSYRADSPIVWITKGVEDNSSGDRYSFIREGWIRVNVQGATATVLQQKPVELGWSVQYFSDQPSKFGIHEISIRPGMEDGKKNCFGETYTGCDFKEPFSSLVAAGIHVETTCMANLAAERQVFFLLTHPSKRPTVMSWTYSSGSGGASTWLTLYLGEKPTSDLCDKSLRP